jgi:hypothetical protein
MNSSEEFSIEGLDIMRLSVDKTDFPGSRSGTMANYIKFETGDAEDSTILVEVSGNEIESDNDGTVKAGLEKIIENSVAIAQKPFTAAVKSAVRHNVSGMIDAISSLANPPSEVEISFGLKATGEAGNIAVGKIGSETNYTIKLVWKRQ